MEKLLNLKAKIIEEFNSLGYVCYDFIGIIENQYIFVAMLVILY